MPTPQQIAADRAAAQRDFASSDPVRIENNRPRSAMQTPGEHMRSTVIEDMRKHDLERAWKRPPA